MAKQSGLGDNFYVGGYDLSGDINSLQNVGGGHATLDVTGINKSAVERIGGLREGRMEFTSYFNNSTSPSGSHPVLKQLPTTDVQFTYCRGTSLGSPAASMIGKQTNYDGTRADDGDFKFQVSAQSNAYGIEWGRLLTAGLRNDTAGTSGSSVDDSAGTSNGLQAYLHVTGFAGTDVTVTIQHSTDNSTWSNLVSFTAATAVGTERVTVAGTVNRYLRVSTAGTFTSATFAVNAVRNQTAVTF